VSKAILEFNLPEEESELHLAISAGNLQSAIWDVSQEVFRPARKHGYNSLEIQGLVERLDQLVSSCEKDDNWPADDYGPMNATDLISLLEKRFYSILEHHGVQL
jgi:hypothetical protein